MDDAAEKLTRFVGRVDTGWCGEPAALGVIVGTGHSYVRDDGVDGIPIEAMGP